MFFDEKEGTSPIVRLLDNFAQVEVLHHAGGGRWEPFDRHNCGPMRLSSLQKCLDLVFSGSPTAAVNRVYQRTGTGPLAEYRTDCSVGFKMRYRPPRQPWIPPGLPISRRLEGRIEAASRARFSRAMIDVLKQHDVLVFLAVRQDLLRWALSKYHGDGTRRPGHIQFKLASGELARDQIPRITVDPDALERAIDDCQAIYAAKRRLAAELRDAGLDVVPVRYEDFLAEEVAFFCDLLAHLGHEVPEEEVRRGLARGAGLERVHGDDLSEFFVNAEELESRFGDRFREWV
jgi:hypothetical protein